jgi:hypothetical protein
MPRTSPVRNSLNLAHYEATGSHLKGGQTELPAQNKPKTIEEETKKIASDIGSFIKKGWFTVSKATTETAAKVGQSQFGQSVKTNLGKAADVTKAGIMVGVEKSKVLGGKIAEVSVKAKDNIVVGYEKTAEATKKMINNTNKSSDEKKTKEYFDQQAGGDHHLDASPAK